MGRYYSGDVEGKWWFGVQSSNTPIKFGGTETFIDYTICNDGTFKRQVKQLKQDLGDKLEWLQQFFDENNGYNDAMLMEFMMKKNPRYDKSELRKDLENFADYEFAMQVKEYFDDTGNEYCHVNSEL
tara:strand:- start:1689 stop:2069 length:381 start_codon:yes stop_codon:yes gene_type:complete